MKTLLWTAAFLGAALSTLRAQDRAAAVVQEPPQANAFVACGGGNSVTVSRPNLTPLTLSGAPYNFSQPFDIVVVPSRNLAVVSNNGAATLTLFDSVPPYTFRGTATVSAGAATNLRGLSVSGDERWVYVAGQITVGPVNNPAVFRLDLNAPANFVLAGQFAAAGAVAEDCVVIDSTHVGGTAGSGPGRVYYSIPAQNRLGIVNENPVTGAASVLVNAAVPPVNTPTQLERSSDGTFFFAGCTTDSAAAQNVIRVVPTPAGETVTYPLVRNGPFFKNFGQLVVDIAFQPNSNAFMLVSEQGVGSVLIEVDAAGTNLNTQNEPPGVSPAGRIRFNDNPPQVYFGRTDLTGTTYGLYDPNGGPTASSVPVTTAAGPRAFAFATPPPGPLVSSVWPSGMVSVAGSTIEIRGASFDPASVVEFVNAAGVPLARTKTFVSPGLIVVDGNGLSVGLYEVRVTNPDTQDFRLVDFFLSIQPPAVVRPFNVTVPSRFEGYALRSVPQYLSAGDLLAAVTAAFGGYSPSNVRAFLQEGGGYVELNQVEPTRDLSGSPFWILSRLGGTITLSKPPVGESLQGAGVDQKVVIIESGWNLLTQPTFNELGFPTPGGGYDLSGVAVFSNSALTVPASPGGSLVDTAGDGTTSFPAEYVNGSYVFLTAADRMFTGQGYWLRNNTTGPLYLRFLTSDAQPKLIAAARSVAPAASALPPPPPGAAIVEEAGTSGCGLPGLELLALLGFLHVRSRRKLAA